MHLTTGAITSVLDRLEKAGWAKRIRDPDDRRRVLVEVAPRVKQLGREIYGDPETAFAEFPDYTEKELELLLDWTRRGREWTESRIARVQALPKRRRHEKRLTGRGRA
jgi:DNA-binding MarR family transcriptional regulator